LLNTTATTINFGGAAATINIGDTSGNTSAVYIGGNLTIPYNNSLTVNNIFSNANNNNPITIASGFSSNSLINIGSSNMFGENVFIIGGGDVTSTDTPSVSLAGFNITDGGAYIQGNLMVYGGNIYGPNAGILNVGSANTTINIGDILGGTSTVQIGGTCTATSFTTTSDYRIKENPKPLDESFNVDKLRPVTYKNKTTEKQDIGFIAHEVQEEFPCLVTGEKDGEKMQSLNYIGLIGVLVKEIQELKKRVSILENK
jgi:hypothetical protein